MPEPTEVRLTAAASPVATRVYVAALVAYVALGLVFKSAVLNWIVGPLFLVAVVDICPRLLTRARATRSRR